MSDAFNIDEYAQDIAEDLIANVDGARLAYTEEQKVWQVVMGEIDKRQKQRLMNRRGGLHNG